MKKTLVFGASLKSNRYSNLAVRRLLQKNIDTCAFGLRKGQIGTVTVRTDPSDFQGVHTITLYLGPKRQMEYYDVILKLKPERVIFNPGTENPDFYTVLQQEGIHYETACTLVLLSMNAY